VFERLNTPQEAYNYKLGAALKMEQTVLDMLDKNVEEAQHEQVKQLFRHHQDETRQQIANIEQAFALFGWDVVSLLEQNLEQERHTLREVLQAEEQQVAAVL
jgi:ferritin-like metal-binding protein YciE